MSTELPGPKVVLEAGEIMRGPSWAKAIKGSNRAINKDQREIIITKECEGRKRGAWVCERERKEEKTKISWKEFDFAIQNFITLWRHNLLVLRYFDAEKSHIICGTASALGMAYAWRGTQNFEFLYF
jgi:hypothetical protein